MPFTLPALPYGFDALEPHIDAQTMQIHHGKHHQAYVDNANKALAGTKWADMDPVAVIQSLGDLPEDKRGPVRNNAGGHVNHSMFWQLMAPAGNGGGAAKVTLLRNRPPFTRINAAPGVVGRADLPWTGSPRPLAFDSLYCTSRSR